MFVPIVGAVVLYVFGVAGATLFGGIDDVRWGSFGAAVQSLLFVALQDIPEVLASLSDARGAAVAFLSLYGGSVLFLVIKTAAAVMARHLESGAAEGDD